MATPTLTIRNVTTTALQLKRLERFETAPSKKLCGILSSAQLALAAESFKHLDVSIPLSPFETKTTDVQIKPKEVLRLTFEVDGQRYRVDTPTESQRSTVLTPLSPSPRFEYTAIYLPKEHFLTLYSSAKLASWMSKLKDETPLSALSIPGTHNSPTYHVALPSVRCQAVGVRQQLDNGVRFLDIRVQPESSANPSEKLILVHSAFPVSLTGHKYLRRLVEVVHAFLDANPTETVIMSLKREGISRANDAQLSQILHKHYTAGDARWFTDNRIPALGEARGKIVLMRRFGLHESLHGENGGKGWCLDAESWPDNCADGMCASGEIRVQDFYEVAETNIEKKTQMAVEQLQRAAKAVCVLHTGDMDAAKAAAGKQPFFFNFLTASNFWRAGCWPDRVAAKVNPVVVDHLCRKHNEDEDQGGDGSTGIVVCDWVGVDGDWDLVRCIVGMNAKLEFREH